jgi:hypothetical protein
LRHASAPLATKGLDMRADHPAFDGIPILKRGSHASAPFTALGKHNLRAWKRNWRKLSQWSPDTDGWGSAARFVRLPRTA